MSSGKRLWRWLTPPLALLALVAALLLWTRTPDRQVRIFHGATVLTMAGDDDGSGRAEAVATRGGEIIAVGSLAEVCAAAGPGARGVDLKGATLLPGLIASHEHPLLGAIVAGAVDMSGFTHRSAAAVWAALAKAVDEAPEGQWVFGFGLDPVLVPDLVVPDRAQLDRIAPDNPVLVLSQPMHSAWVNSRAMEEAGVGPNTPDPGHGSVYGRDARGTLNGRVDEIAAMRPFFEEMLSAWAILTAYDSTLQGMVDSGYSSVASLGFNMPWPVTWFLDLGGTRIRQFSYLAREEFSRMPDSPDRETLVHRILGGKLWLDGSPYTAAMHLREPYLNSSTARRLGFPGDTRGHTTDEPERFVADFRRLDRQGFQMAVHCQGDQAATDLLKTLALLDDGPRFRAQRHRVEHGLLPPIALLPHFAAHGATFSFHIDHLYHYGDRLSADILGPERAARMLPVRSALEAGLRPTLHSDSPMFDHAPMSLLQTAVTRRSRSGQKIGPDQALTVAQALRALTLNAAYQLHAEDQLGSIERGKRADFTVLADNPLEISPERLRALEVTATFVDGQCASSRCPGEAETAAGRPCPRP